MLARSSRATVCKKPWADGTASFLFTPLELLGRIAAIIPPFHSPRIHHTVGITAIGGLQNIAPVLAGVALGNLPGRVAIGVIVHQHQSTIQLILGDPVAGMRGDKRAKAQQETAKILGTSEWLLRVDEVVQIDVLLDGQVGVVGLRALVGQGEHLVVGFQVAVDGLVGGAAPVDGIVLFVAAAEVLLAELGVWALHGVVETPVQTVEVEVDEGGVAVHLAHVPGGVPVEGVPDVLGLLRIAEVLPAAAALAAEHDAVAVGGLLGGLEQGDVLGFGFGELGVVADAQGYGLPCPVVESRPLPVRL